MKIVFTLFIFITCLKLSAAVPAVDTPKTLAVNRKQDSAKLMTPAQRSDTLKVKGVENRTDSTKIKANPNQADSIKFLVLTKPTGNANTNFDIFKPVATNFNSYSVKATDITIKTDSVKFTMVANQPDAAVKPNINSSKGYASLPALEENDNLRRVTSLIQLDSLRSTIIEEQARQDRLRKLILQCEQVKIAALLKINNLDSLKQELKVAKVDTLRALIYTRIALKYLDYDTISNADKQVHYQNAALNYTLLAIHEYAHYDDSIALRDAYTTLARVYYSQKKYTEAKWFILQANKLSRDRNDTQNIISSLLTLASIKTDIKDYTLAMGDLDEALQLSITNHKPKTELEVLKNYAQFYNTMQNYPKEAMVLQKRDSLLDSLRKSDEAQLAKSAALKKKFDLLNKKKLLSANSRKPRKNSSPTKMASL